MKFNNFKRIMNDIEKCQKLENRYYNILKIDAVWNDHNTVISDLLIEIYGQPAVDYILYEYLSGNKSPITITDDKTGEVTVQPLNTLKDLWHAMEKHKLPGYRNDEKDPIVDKIQKDIDSV